MLDKNPKAFAKLYLWIVFAVLVGLFIATRQH